MNPQIHIHRETITTATTTRTFIVMLPNDVDQVTGVKVSASLRLDPEPKEYHYEIGRIAITRDGCVKYRFDFRYEAVNGNITTIDSINPFDELYAFHSPTNPEYAKVKFPGQPRVLYCKFERKAVDESDPDLTHGDDAPTISDFTLTIYFQYEPTISEQ